MFLFVHELHPPRNRAGPRWAEGTRRGEGAGIGGGGSSEARTDSAERSADLRHFPIHQLRPDHLSCPAR
jgi:hypothetical protein